MHCTSLCKEGGRKPPGNAGTSTRAQRGAALSRVKTRIRRSKAPAREGLKRCAQWRMRSHVCRTPERSRLLVSVINVILLRRSS